MLSENQICGICNLDEGAFVDGCCPTATDNCDRFKFGKLIALNMHKADQKEWKGEKQEMLKEIDEISYEPCPYQSCYRNVTADECFNSRRMTENCEWWTVLKHKWGIE